ncbi:MAG: type IV pilus twitching motility protein PilT [Thermoanaerobaculaceae bacterium]
MAAEKGERLEMVGGQLPVLWAGGNAGRGQRPVANEELEAFLDAVVPPQRLVSFELGEEVRFGVPVAGKSFLAFAQRVGGVVKVTVDFLATADLEVAKVPPPLKVRKPPATSAVSPSVERPLEKLLLTLVSTRGGDLHLSAGVKPMMRLHGEMTPTPGVDLVLTSEHILLMCDEIAPAQREFRDANDTDFAYELPGVARFRVNMFRDRRGVGAAFRQIPHRIVSLEGLCLPECVENLCLLSKGSLLVNGPSGSGKSTTFAAMVDFIKENRADRIITIENPLELVHENKRCLINQREVYSHTGSFKKALWAALREDPDIVRVRELRDLKKMAIAFETAKTGRLVFGTLHTTTAVSTVDRIIDQFPADRQQQVRMMLSDSLKGVIAQILLRRKEGGWRPTRSSWERRRFPTPFRRARHTKSHSSCKHRSGWGCSFSKIIWRSWCASAWLTPSRHRPRARIRRVRAP